MKPSIISEPHTLAVALGANLPSPAGKPMFTLIEVRPKIEIAISDWILELSRNVISTQNIAQKIRFRWSPIFQSQPYGGPPGQPSYLNAVLVVDGEILQKTLQTSESAINLLGKFLSIEKNYGRDRRTPNSLWGPRSLDIDFLAWGSLQVKKKELTLPHPRLIERDFVIVPLAEALRSESVELIRIEPQQNWKE